MKFIGRIFTIGNQEECLKIEVNLQVLKIPFLTVHYGSDIKAILVPEAEKKMLPIDVLTGEHFFPLNNESGYSIYPISLEDLIFIQLKH